MVKRNILLNPGPATTTDSVKQALVVPDICPREQEFGDLVAGIRRKTVDVVNGGDNYTSVLLSGSGTLAMETCLSSVLGQSDKILIIDNGAYGKRAEQIVQVYGMPHLTYRLQWGDFPSVDHVEELLKQNPDMTHLFMVHHETTTGMLNPLEPIIALCRERNIITVIDAISSYAGIPVDLQQTPADYLISSSNKCIQGFAGIGIIIAAIDRLEATERIPPRNFYMNLYQNYHFWKTTQQFQFTPPVQILYALDKALDEFFLETQEGRYRRYCECYQVLISTLDELNLTCLIPEAQRSKLLTAIVEPEIPGYSFNELHDYLYQKDITIYPGKGAKENTFRIANIGSIDKTDMQAAMTELRSYFSTLQS